MSADFPMNSDDICRQMQQQFGSNSNSNSNSNGNSNNSNSNSNNNSANSNSNSNGNSNGNNSGSGNDAPEMLQLDPNLDFTIADLLGHSPQDSHDANSRNGSGNPWSLPMYFGEPKADFPIAMMATPSPPPPPPPPPPPLPPPPAVAQPASAQQQQGGHKHPIRDLTLLRDESRCVSTVDPLVVHDPRSRMGYIIQYMTKMHVTFARTRCLPFIHHRLYASRLPRTMMTAFAAASAYAGRTPDTKPWVMKLLGDAAADILAHGGWARPTSATASASPVPVNAGPHSPLERLARVQAMVLLDSMRIFDGDILLRNAAEADNVVLDAWIDDLVMLRDDLENVLGHAPNNQTPKSWDAWILLESIRRTVVMALPMKCLLHLMKQPQIGPCMQPSKTSWTASQHLWTAGTSVDFYHSWRTKPRWWITDWDFDDFWMYARAEDADEFTKLLLT
ncbi:Fungal Zn(2)-Cys(6) binuclear cluster domain, partial [Geosmithia morbida]